MLKTEELKDYFRYQSNICFNSRLFGTDIKTHGGKVLMLFAEIYSFMVNEFGLDLTFNMLVNYENSKTFMHWFWKIKHNLGQNTLKDPDFVDIGKWIGKGFFLKIIYSIIIDNEVLLSEHFSKEDIDQIVKRLIERQKKILQYLIMDNYFSQTYTTAIKTYPSGYHLLGENVMLNFENENFKEINCIL